MLSLVPHRDDRDAARSRIEALERQLAEAEAEREEAQAELEQAEAARRALERRLASGEPHVARPPAEPAWSRDEFAKRIAALSPEASLPPLAPVPRPRVELPPPLSRPALFATRGPGRPEVSTGPVSRGRARLAAALTTLIVHAFVASLVSLPRVAGAAHVVTTVMVAFVCAQAVLNAVVLAKLQARHPARAFSGSLLTTVLSAYVLTLGGGAGFPGDPVGLGLYLGASVLLASYVVGGVATSPGDGRPAERSEGG